MRKRVLKIGLWVGSALTAVRAIIWWIGDAETVYDVFSGRGQIVKVISKIVLSPWFGPAIVVPCFLAYLWLERRQQLLSRWLDTETIDASATADGLSGAQPAVPPSFSGATLGSIAPTAPLQAGDRIVVNVTPEYLVGLFRDHTSIQADKLAAPYIGKWIEISGPLGDVFPRKCVGDSRYTSSVFFADRGVGDQKAWISMQFDEAWIDRLIVLPRGGNIRICGQMKVINKAEIELDNCELVAVEQFPVVIK